MTKIPTPTDRGRTIPGDGKNWLAMWLDRPEPQMGILEHFANTIKAANKLGENIWSTSVLDNAITLNVCDHLILKIQRHTVDVTLSRASIDADSSHSELSLRKKFNNNGGVDIKPFPRKSVHDKRDPLPLCYCCSIHHDNFLKAIPLIEGEYQKALAIAVQRHGKIRKGESEIKSGDGPWAKSPSYNFIRHLREAVSDQEVPQPVYKSHSEHFEKLSNGRPDSSLAVEPKSGSEQVDGAQGELNSPPVVTVGAANGEPKKILDVEPELPGEALDAKVQLLLESGKLAEPKGNANPSRKVATSDEFFRDPQVKAWVWQNADGVCELCRNAAPFKNAKGHPYLEVHHVIPLSEEGRDMHTNAVALCPNCHRECHFGEDWNARKERLYETVVRLVKA